MQPRLDLRLSQRLIMTPQLQQPSSCCNCPALNCKKPSRNNSKKPLLEEGSSELEDPRRRQALPTRARIRARVKRKRRTLQEKPAEMKPAGGVDWSVGRVFR